METNVLVLALDTAASKENQLRFHKLTDSTLADWGACLFGWVSFVVLWFVVRSLSPVVVQISRTQTTAALEERYRGCDEDGKKNQKQVDGCQLWAGVGDTRVKVLSVQGRRHSTVSL